MAFDEPPRANAAPGVILSGRIEIFPSQPLPELSTPAGQAYTARFNADASSSLYAIICLSRLPPRLESVQTMRNIDNPSILRLVEGGVVQWIDGSYAYALVYQKPTAPRMLNALDEVHPPLGEDTVNRHFISPMIGALTALTNAGMVHNEIRPTNIYWRSGTAMAPQLGECLSVPAGYGQPVLFEPIERATSAPLGRGPGIHPDDCYSFGVTLAFLVLGRNPLQGLDDAAIIDLKMTRGSFAAIVGNQRLSPTHIEILRGLLADDSMQRWTAGDLDLWLSGRRMTPKASDAGRRASRQFVFLGKEYWQIGPLAEAFAKNTVEATKVIENESVKKWLLRALNDKERARDVDDVITDLKQSGKTAHYEDQLVARTCIALDRAGPIRYRGIAAMPAGLPTLLVDAVSSGNNLQTVSELIVSPLTSLWIQMQEQKADHIALGQLFDRMRMVMEKGSYGNGVERAVYEANPGLPCLSPMLRNQYVISPKLLLPALERVASSSNKAAEPMDRHIAAFLIARERRGESAFVAMGIPDDPIRHGLALLGLFAELQYKFGPESLPNLAAWLAPAIEPAMKRFLSKPLRESVQKRAKECIAAGNLSQLVQLLDNPNRLERDKQDFFAARLLYLNIQKEILHLEGKMSDKDDIARTMGKPLAASVASFLAIILVCAAVLRAFFSALLFN